MKKSPDSKPSSTALAEAQRQRDTPDTPLEPAFQALNASAHFDRVLYDGGEFGTATAAGSPEEEDYLGLAWRGFLTCCCRFLSRATRSC